MLSCEVLSEQNDAFASVELQNMQLYLPYFALLVTFVLSYFILTSENYQSLLQHYIDKEVKLQMQNKSALRKQSTLSQPSTPGRSSAAARPSEPAGERGAHEQLPLMGADNSPPVPRLPLHEPQPDAQSLPEEDDASTEALRK